MHDYGIKVDGETGGEELRQLLQWLRDDEYVGEEAALTLAAAPAPPGAMGAAFDVIQLSVDSGFQVANMVLAITLWRRGRAKPPTVTIERNGVRVDVISDDPVVVAQVVSALEAV